MELVIKSDMIPMGSCMDFTDDLIERPHMCFK